ncbi:response regulator [Spirosoma agri]|jgi:CheY-like chemotaxis protein|uniref:Response regulator n=1 Tax=Spirosoma agri TaxID=1987381 RepID=A0A6M0IMP6_9BACT|nr:response regulator [Spirosoma agri]NEU69559.1 response regulator [Spirosoma agri]
MMQQKQPFLILVVDDEPPIFDLITTTAQTRFPQATFVNTRSVQETLDYLQNQEADLPQLILSDIDLQQSRDGFDLLDEIRTKFKGKIPVIMLTVLADPTAVKRAYDKGVTAYTQKPEDMTGWRNYIDTLKAYWHDTNFLPSTPPT